MNRDPQIESLRQQQVRWARERGLSVDDRGYLPHYAQNLRAPLSSAAEATFVRGSGAELRDRENSPAKMRALHSSSALAVNAFDFWNDRDLGPVLRALDVDGRASRLEFEAQLPTGARGTPPNLDVLIHIEPEGLVGVESKFTEWMTPKVDQGASLSPYLSGDTSYWSRAGFTAAHRLATDVMAGRDRFEYLDVPQLLKHALGLTRAASGRNISQLRYIYFDARCTAQHQHANEIARFSEIVGAEITFRATTYQEFVAKLQPPSDAEERNYLAYLHQRYFARADSAQMTD